MIVVPVHVMVVVLDSSTIKLLQDVPGGKE